MTISLIAAMSENRVIGRDGRVPWHLPADMRHFKQLTMSHPVVMGRKTFETLPKPLEGRRNIVVTRDPAYGAPGAEVVTSLDAALEATEDADEAFVAGGEAIYAIALPHADRIYLTVVHAAVDGDTFFPPFDSTEWKMVSDEPHEADERHEFAFSFRLYARRRTR